MNPDTATQLLTDPDQEPTLAVLEIELGELYPLYTGLIALLESSDLGLGSEWRYYKDAKGWLCKITKGKKTVVWMSAWKECLNLGFYFTEKTGVDIPGLEIAQDLKDNYATAKPVGKLKPLTIDLTEPGQLQDLETVLRYKVSKL